MQMFCSASPAPTGPPHQSRPGTNRGNRHKVGSAAFKVVWYVSFFLLKNLALFVSAVVSAVGPDCKGKPEQHLLPMLEYAGPCHEVEGSGGKRAASATLLNQAMSFAAVAGVTMWLGTKKSA